MVGLLSWGKEESLPLKGGGISITLCVCYSDLGSRLEFPS